MSSQIQQQISKLQSQLDSKKSVKIKEKASSRQRRKSRSRSRTPKRGEAKAMRDHASTVSKVKAKGGFDGSLDLTRAKIAAIRPLTVKKKELDLRLQSAVKDNLYMACQHVYVKSTDKNATYRECVKCKQSVNQLVDEKAPVVLRDTDDLKALYDMVCKEYAMARDSLRAGIGNRPIKMKLTMAFKITTTVTTGVTNTVTCGGITTGIRLDQTNEFSSISALFDEAKVTGGHVDFIYSNPVTIPNSTTGINLTTTNMPTIAFDPSDATAALSVAALHEYAQHKNLSPLMANTAGGSATITAPAEGMKHHFKWNLPKGFMEGATFAGQQWIDMNDATGFAFGMLKFYHVGLVATAADTGIGMIILDCEFRCRQ